MRITARELMNSDLLRYYPRQCLVLKNLQPLILRVSMHGYSLLLSITRGGSDRPDNSVATKPDPSMRRVRHFIAMVTVLTACLLAVSTSVHAAVGFLKIHMIAAGDGRGDCFLIELPDNTRMVVDIPSGYSSTLRNKLSDLGIPSIKYLVGTHEHVDHIGGMNEFLDSGFAINNTKIYYPKGAINANGANENAMVTAATNRDLTVFRVEAGDYIINTTHDGKPFKVRVISPETYKINGGDDDWGSENEASLVLKITYGTKSILMQADGYGSTELTTLAGPFASEINSCQVLKVGHHGVPANGALSCRPAYLDAAGVTRALITDGDLAIDATIRDRLQERNIHYWSSGSGDGYCWLSTDGESDWIESEPPLWPLPVAPSITTQPTGQIVNAGSSVTFTVSASGTAPLSYQWRFNGTNIAAANAASYTKTNVQSANAGNYSVVVTNAAGSVTSANAILSVRVPPTITSHPVSQTVAGDSSVTFTVLAGGTPPLNFQWFFNSNAISGAISPTLNLSDVNRTNSGFYYVRVTNNVGGVTSTNALLRVLVPQTLQALAQDDAGKWSFKFNDADGTLLTTNELSDFEVQSTTNLVEWSTFTGSLTWTNGVIHFREPDTNTSPTRYFRVRSK